MHHINFKDREFQVTIFKSHCCHLVEYSLKCMEIYQGGKADSAALESL